jgi:hypothetical protein
LCVPFARTPKLDNVEDEKFEGASKDLSGALDDLGKDDEKGTDPGPKQ